MKFLRPFIDIIPEENIKPRYDSSLKEKPIVFINGKLKTIKSNNDSCWRQRFNVKDIICVPLVESTSENQKKIRAAIDELAELDIDGEQCVLVIKKDKIGFVCCNSLKRKYENNIENCKN